MLRKEGSNLIHESAFENEELYWADKTKYKVSQAINFNEKK
jgi:hypothetical protein